MSLLLEDLEALRGDWAPQDYSVRLSLFEESVAIASDVHIPYHDERLLARFLETTAQYGCQAIVWLGDLMDMPTHSSWGTDDLTTLFTREMDLTAGVIRLAAQFVNVQYWSSGNHEDRFIRRLGKQVGMLALARMLGLQDLIESGQLVVSDNPTLELFQYPESGGVTNWLLTHPTTYSATPLVVPGTVADRERKHVVAGHAHHWAMGTSPGGFTAIESGGLFEPKLMKYIQHGMTKHRKWCKGFVILDHGEPHLVRG
jgi:UDP-2,3-diacylglucosamine pyrophosphatase LpxH